MDTTLLLVQVVPISEEKPTRRRDLTEIMYSVVMTVLQYLPEHVANQLLQLLLLKGRVHSPSLLDTFRHALTRLTINVKQLKLQLGAEWIAYIAGLRWE